MHLFFLLSTGTVVNMVITINWFVQHFKCKIVRNPKMMNLWMHSSRLIANGHGYCTRSVPYNDIILSKIHQRSSNLARCVTRVPELRKIGIRVPKLGSLCHLGPRTLNTRNTGP